MQFKLTSPDKKAQHCDCLILGIAETKTFAFKHKALSASSQVYVSHWLKQHKNQAKLGQSLVLHNVPGLKASSLLIMGLGAKPELSEKEFKDLIKNTWNLIKKLKLAQIDFGLHNLVVPNVDLAWKIKQIVNIGFDLNYQFNNFKSKKPEQFLQNTCVNLSIDKSELKLATTALKLAEAINQGIQLTKDLANTPPNVCTPDYIAQAALKLGKYPSIKVKVLKEKDIVQEKMATLLSVAMGSINPPRFAVLEYNGSKTKTKTKPIVIVGKGISFDTGGNSLKPAMSMMGMKYDMCGAATVIGTFQAVAELNLPIRLIGLMPCAENMPGGSANRPDDIVTSRSGQTVEILNTDAEGRLILCDALHYAEQFKPAAVINVATLTGAIVVALGRHATGLFSNNDELSQALLLAGERSGDKAWPLPLWEEYEEALYSKHADLANIGLNGDAGSIHAACFLAKFTKNYPWAHLDVAGTATKYAGKDKEASGRPVALLVEYLLAQTVR